MTDLPDAVVEAAANGIGHDDDCGPERTPSGNCWCGSVGTARAALAAASGPWAEQLDAAGWRTEAYDARKQIAGLAAERDAALARNAELKERLLLVAQLADETGSAFPYVQVRELRALVRGSDDEAGEDT